MNMKFKNKSMQVIEEKPPDEALVNLTKKYPNPIIRDLEWDMGNIELVIDYPKCIGEAVLIIRNAKNEFIMIKHHPNGKWRLPMGRIFASETIEEGALREAREETGLDIKLNFMSAIHKITIKFKNVYLKRWHFIFCSEIISGKFLDRNKREIVEVGLFKQLPKDCGDYDWASIWLQDAKV